MNETLINVCDYGARGNGKSDDTEAIRKAISALPPCGGGVIYFPPGNYLTDTIYGPNFATLMGNAAFGYQEAGGTVLSPLKKSQARLIDLNGKRGTRIVGLTLHGKDMGEEMDGIYLSRPGNNEQNIVIDGCRIEHFTGSGIAMNEAHVWCIRHCIIFANKKDGIDAHAAFDGWIIDNQIAANRRYGINVNNSVTITANRIEHSGQSGIFFNRHFSQHVQITGNLFCTNHGPAIEILEGNVRAIVITGNTIRNSGYGGEVEEERRCHVRFEGVQGLVFNGNALHVLWCNYPEIGMRIKGLVDSVIANNTLFKGAMKALINDLGGHNNTIIQNNPGSLKLENDIDS